MSDELMQLCCKRPCITPEIHSQNDYYGHAANLKRYLGIDPGYSFKFIIEHGPNMSVFVWDIKVTSPFKYLMCATNWYAKVFHWKTQGVKNGFPVGVQLQFCPAQPVEDKYIVVFPPHSGHYFFQNYSCSDYIKFISENIPLEKPLLVCVGWKDVQRGYHLEFQKLGLQTTSAGHMFDNNFLPRLSAIFDKAALIISGVAGTEIIYAGFRGIPAIYIPPNDLDRTYNKDFIGLEKVVKNTEMIDAARSLFDYQKKIFFGFDSTITPKKQRYINMVSGKKYIRKRSVLWDFILNAEFQFCKNYNIQFNGIPCVNGKIIR